MDAVPIKIDVLSSMDGVIERVEYDLSCLKVLYRCGGKLVEVAFDAPQGFRCLDEGDMVDFWMMMDVRAGRLFEVISGGWKALESSKECFVPGAYREFLLAGVDDCLSVFCQEEPSVKVLDHGER